MYRLYLFYWDLLQKQLFVWIIHFFHFWDQKLVFVHHLGPIFIHIFCMRGLVMVKFYTPSLPIVAYTNKCQQYWLHWHLCFIGLPITSKNGLHQTRNSGIKFLKIALWVWLTGFFNVMHVLSSASLWWNPIIQVENTKKSRFSFLGMLITSKNGLHWTLDSGNWIPEIFLWEWLYRFFNGMQVLSSSSLRRNQKTMWK